MACTLRSDRIVENEMQVDLCNHLPTAPQWLSEIGKEEWDKFLTEKREEAQKKFEEENDSVDLGYDEAVVKRTTLLLDRSEYKRKQSPPGVKITPRNFGRDRRIPLINKYKNW